MRNSKLMLSMLIGTAIVNGVNTAHSLQHHTPTSTILTNISWAIWGISAGIVIDYHLRKRN